MKTCAILLCLMLCVTPFATAYSVSMDTAQILPYPGDCSKYQQCDQSGCFIMSCGKGTEFNPAINTCDYPLRDRSGCGNRG